MDSESLDIQVIGGSIMGQYTTRMLTDEEAKKIIETIKHGYINADGTKRRPNDQIATILLLQCNLGCRINDIMHLETSSIVPDGDGFRLDIVEQKTHKKRTFVVPKAIKNIIDDYTTRYGISCGRLFDVSAPAVWKSLRQVSAFLGLNNVSCHSFRKAAGLRVYMDSGKDIALTCQYYQHAAPSTTMKYLQRNTKQMDDVLSASILLP